MNIILGASGQVGSHIVSQLDKSNTPVRAVIRQFETKFDPNVEVRSADLFNSDQLVAALDGAETVFLLTPENPTSKDILGETRQIIANYREAIKVNKISKIVGLSSIGAHLDGDTGNLQMSRMMEQGFDDMEVQKVFIRPSYYFSNWLGFIEPMKQYGVLPTFFPVDLEIDMISPLDVAKFTADQIILSQKKEKEIQELVGPNKYSSLEVANIFSKVLDKEITVQPVPKEQWKNTLTKVGFTNNTATNLIKMTQVVVDKKAVPAKSREVKKLPTTLDKYLREQFGR